MSKRPKFLYYFVLLLALAAAVYLAGKTQETRKSASFAGARINILPEAITGKVGGNIPVAVWVTGNKITGSEELVKVSSLDATVCFGDGLALNLETLDEAIQLNTEAFKSVAFKQIYDLPSPVEGTKKCLKMVLISTGIQPSDLKSGTFRAATIRFKGSKEGSGKVIINTALMGGYNPAPGATDMSIEVTEKKGANYVVSGTVATGEVEFVNMQMEQEAIGDVVSGFVKFNIGSKKLSGVDFRIKYDKTKLKFVEIAPILALKGDDSSLVYSYYKNACDTKLFKAAADLLDKIVDEDKGIINLKGVSMETDETKMATGRVCLAVFKFKALVNGEAAVTLDSDYENSAAGYFSGQVDQSMAVGNVIPVTFHIGGQFEPTPTPPMTGAWPVLKYLISFRDVTFDSPCVNNWPVVITVMAPDGTKKIYADQIPTRDTSVVNKMAYLGKLVLTDFPYYQNLAVFIKGPKHLQNKYGVNNQTSYYNQAGGAINLSSINDSAITYDFTGYPLMPGDVTGETSAVQDGVVDGRDYAYVKASATNRDKVDEGGYLSADMNADCGVNAIDTALFKQTLKDKMEQMY